MLKAQRGQAVEGIAILQIYRKTCHYECTTKNPAGQLKETELYLPLKSFLEAQGYEVKAEVTHCDIVAIRNDEPPLIVEMKTTLSLELLMQGIARQAITDTVYVAFPAGKGKAWLKRAKDTTKLCRRLGLGLISVRLGSNPRVLVHADPGPYAPRKSKRLKTALLKEFQSRVGDPNTGGQTRQTIMTAYRQDALCIARAIQLSGPTSPANLAKTLEISRAASILQQNYYGWFVRVKRGVYDLDRGGHEALNDNTEILRTLP